MTQDSELKTHNSRLDLAIEAASDDTGVALSAGGVIVRSLVWNAHQTQSQTLLPNIERLLDEDGRTKADIGAVFIDVGPGGYASLRVGVSIAKALAHALRVPLVGVGRLELDAALVAAEAGAHRIVAVHRAGRGDLACATYRADAEGVREESPPRIEARDAWRRSIAAGDVVTGDLDDELTEIIAGVGASVAQPRGHRVEALASIGRRRVDAGRTHDPGSLVPLYLRAPAIGPARPQARG
jgi:tRNA threonylcarbamoyladenosine biosynthesis protein TsaB